MSKEILDKNTLNLLTKIRINRLEYYLHTSNAGTGMILQIILLVLFFITAIFVPSEMATLLFIFPIINCCIALITNYQDSKFKEELKCFKDDLEFNITGKVTYKLFYRMTDGLNKKKFHFGVTLDPNGYIESWSIYRKDMPLEQYFSTENKPLLTSTKNDIFDLLNFIKEQENV